MIKKAKKMLIKPLVLSILALLLTSCVLFRDDPAGITGLNYGVWFNTVWAEWPQIAGVNSFTVELIRNGGPPAALTGDCAQFLIRRVNNGWRVDAPGLHNDSNYVMHIRRADTNDIVHVTSGLQTTPFDRQGYAFIPAGPRPHTLGAYYLDGTPRTNAEIIYVTHENMNEALDPARFPAAGGNSTTPGGNPLIIRFIGTVGVLGYVGDHSGIPVAARNANSFLTIRNSTAGITIEGIGPDAVIYGFGFQIHSSSDVVVRNLSFRKFFEDAIGIHGNNSHVQTHFWIHNNTIYTGQDSRHLPGRDDDHRFGDGAVDITNWANHFTVSYNRFVDSDKVLLWGNSMADMITYGTLHHNWFINAESRMPRVRNGWIHVFNNLYDGVRNYAIGAGHRGNIIAEGNTFRNARRPFIISGIGHGGTSLGEDYPGAIITNLVPDYQILTGRALQPNDMDTFSRITFDPALDIGAHNSYTRRIHTGEVVTRTHTFVPFNPPVSQTIGSAVGSTVGVQTAADSAAKVRAYAGVMRR